MMAWRLPQLQCQEHNWKALPMQIEYATRAFNKSIRAFAFIVITLVVCQAATAGGKIQFAAPAMGKAAIRSGESIGISLQHDDPEGLAAIQFRVIATKTGIGFGALLPSQSELVSRGWQTMYNILRGIGTEPDTLVVVSWAVGTPLLPGTYQDLFRLQLQGTSTAAAMTTQLSIVDVVSAVADKISRPGNIVSDSKSAGKLPVEVVMSAELSQNYPNPFNPSTHLRFVVPDNGSVKLELFNILGQHIRTLADGVLGMGMHDVDFDASGLPAGMYIYRLTGDGWSLARRMTLLK
jgi:hypothetical protein